MWNLPAATKVRPLRMETFRGCDFTNEPANVSLSRSPYAPNMIRESVGKVRKRTGYHTIKEYPKRINGVHEYHYTENGKPKVVRVVHAGDKIYTDPETVLYNGAADDFSVSRQMDEYLVILDGKKALVMTSPTEIKPLEEIAYVPTILIARKPTGGGEILEPVNLLSPKRIVRFSGTAEDKTFQLPSTELDTDEVKVQVLTSSGKFDDLIEGTDFTVNRTAGTITFNTAPGVSPILGQDNIYVTYSKTVEGYADKINKCNIVTLYGVGGTRDRMFVAGNPEYPHQDYYSQLKNPTYFGDLWYSELGQKDSRIMGYSIINNSLATHKDWSADGTNIFIRTGTIINGEASFIISGAYQGTGAISKHSFGVLETEPVFLTRDGIFAVTPSDVLGERYAQNRSYFLNRKLLQEPNLENAYSVIWNQMYVLAVNNNLYFLDGTQYALEKNDPFSRRQYEAYFWPNIPARILFLNGDALCFGTEDGRICEFYTDYDFLVNFNDDGEPIAAQWYTPEIYGTDFYKNKSFKRIAVLLASAVATGCRVWAIYDGIKELVMDYSGAARYFSFSNLSFEKLSFKSDKSPQSLMEKIKIRNVYKVQFIIENDVLNEPMGLYAITTEYKEKK